MRALIIEDDPGVARFARRVLEEQGFAVDIGRSGEEGHLLALALEYDAILVDIGLPDRSGLAVLQAIRRAGRRAGILAISGRGGEEQEVRALDAGADDFLPKPFTVARLVARVRALVRRGGASRTESLVAGSLVLNRLTRETRIAGEPVALTAREFALLEHLLLHAGEVVTRSDLLERVWGLRYAAGSNVVDAKIARLRHKLGAHAGAPRIETARGVGFRLVWAG